MQEAEVFDVIGEEGFEKLIAAFYRQVPGDPLLGPMYPAGELEEAEQRLRDFLVGRFGGPSRYVEQRGHPRLRMRHMAFPIDQAARDRWVELMRRALDQADLPAEAAQVLRAFFETTSTFLMNRA